MATQALIRPIEINAVNNRFTIGATTYTIPSGTYANIFMVLKAGNKQMVDGLISVRFYLGTSHKVVAYHEGAANFTLDFVATPALGLLLGFIEQQTGDSTYTATYTPEYCFIPTYCSSDRERFTLGQKGLFSGSTVRSGRLVGIQTGADIYSRRFDWPAESANKTHLEAARTVVTAFGDDYYPEEARCFEYFVKHARTAYPSDPSYTLSRGCFYLEDIEDFEGITTYDSYPDNFGSGSTNKQIIDLGYYVFCAMDPAGAPPPRKALPRGREYYDLTLELNTADAPTFVSVVI